MVKTLTLQNPRNKKIVRVVESDKALWAEKGFTEIIKEEGGLKKEKEPAK